ncbi:hypothetical protein Tco_1500207 [Tanacetum coccineum]
MMNYLKNQGTWKLSQLKNLSFEEVKKEFDKLTKTPKRLKDDEEVEAKDDEPTKKSRKRRKQIARKGLHTSVDKDDSEVQMQGEKGAYQIVREDGTDVVYINFGAMLKIISRDDLTELYRIVMNRYGMDGPEDDLQKVFWKYLKNMFVEPLMYRSIYGVRKREALQAKKVKSFKASKTETSSALRSKTPTKSSSVNTPIVPPNMLGPDLNGKAVNESQYRGMIGSLMHLTASRPDIQFSTGLYARHQANIRNPTLFLLREFSEKALQMLIKNHTLKGDIEFHFIPTQYQLVDILIKLMYKPSIKRLIDELVIFMDTAYGRRGIRHIGNWLNAFSCEDLALIRRISFRGYGVLVRIE